MKIKIIILLILAVSSTALGQAKDKESKRRNGTEQQIIALNKLWADSITKADVAALNNLFADEMIVTAGNGDIRNKSQEIKDAASVPDPNFVWTNPFITEDVRVKVYKEAALVTGLAKWGFKYKEQQVNQERRYTHMYVKQQGKWRIIAQQISLNLYANKISAPANPNQ